MDNDEAITLVIDKLRRFEERMDNTCLTLTKIDTYIITKESERDKATNFKIKSLGLIIGAFSLAVALVVKFI